ncbi:MAG: tetratricopeptide repeat protein [Phycisphaerales bacterium]|nr:tetratricopeptide repeat protein [Phycisphaerales bacterium]
MRRSKSCICIVTVVGTLAIGCSQHSDTIFSEEPRISPMTHYYSGRVLERQNDLLGAIQQYGKAVDADPKLVEAYAQLSVLYQRLDRVDEAQKILKQGIDENPESAVLRNNFGFCCLLMNDFVGAEQQFQAALGLSPHFDQARMNLAIVLARTDRMSQSAAEFAHVVSEDVAYYNVAVICMDMDDYVHAEWALQNALASNPDFGPAKTDLPRVALLASREREKSSPPVLETSLLASAVDIIEEPIELMMMPVLMNASPEEAPSDRAEMNQDDVESLSWTAHSTMTLVEEPIGTK